MQFPRFELPDPSIFEQQFGAEVDPSDVWSYHVKMPLDEGQSMEISLDASMGSVSIRWKVIDRTVISIYRERIEKVEVDPKGYVTCTGETDSILFRLSIGLYPVEFLDSLMSECSD
ncbi:hypothetical protein [Nocardia lasii]|uniref:SCP2 domain-containing protein n=1 Tax=Nocardia lasii TaxID=1616107 RepID=A0ABW1JSY4_9NOCA